MIYNVLNCLVIAARYPCPLLGQDYRPSPLSSAVDSGGSTSGAELFLGDDSMKKLQSYFKAPPACPSSPRLGPLPPAPPPPPNASFPSMMQEWGRGRVVEW